MGEGGKEKICKDDDGDDDDEEDYDRKIVSRQFIPSLGEENQQKETEEDDASVGGGVEAVGEPAGRGRDA